MESLFFNTPNQRYQTAALMRSGTSYLDKVDISNGIFFYHGRLGRQKREVSLKNLERMVVIAVVKQGELQVEDHITGDTYTLGRERIGIFVSSRQDLTLGMQGEIFILFIADFFLKRYLSFAADDPVDYLYAKIQKEISFEEVSRQALDAYSLYSIEKIIDTRKEYQMKSLRCMHRVMECMIHCFSLLDMPDARMDTEDYMLAMRAKDMLLKHYIAPPTIAQLAHRCATNETRLKKVFKQAYKTTIYGYIQRLRLEQANLLLREENLSIGEISRSVGYRHQGHFSKLFFSVYGVYPKDLKR